MIQDSSKASPSQQLKEVWPVTMAWALSAASICCSVLLMVALMQARIEHDSWADTWSMLSLSETIYYFAPLALFLFAVFFAGRTVWVIRNWLERAFGWAGFFATFFGLAVLALLFLQLAIDASQWFLYMPTLIEARNDEYRKVLEQTKNPREFANNQLETVRAELETDAELVRSALTKVQQSINDLTPNSPQKKDSNTAKKLDELKEKAKELQARLAFLENEKDREKLLQMKEQDYLENAKEMYIVAKDGIRENPTSWNILYYYLTHGTSNEPQNSGIYPALLGSLWIALITILFAVPVGVGAALYLEEYRSSNWFGKLVQININNLAGVPSVVYGILGAFVFVELVFKPIAANYPNISARNLLGGGLTLGLLTLPVIIVAAQEAIRAVPRSIREGAYALGATRWQVTWLQVLPQARPGILTGTILAISRAIGEAAPLVLFGALLVVNQAPSLFSQFSVLPLQIFEWAGRPPMQISNEEKVEIWRYNAAMASIVLLLLLLTLNAFALYLRSRSRKIRW